MKRLTLWALLLLGLPVLTVAQTTEGYRINGRIRGLRDSSVVLAHYQYDATHYVPKDTARADAEGNVVFEGRKKLPDGLYLVVLPKGRFFDLVMIEPRFSFETDTTDLQGSMKITGSVENEAFYGYQHKLGAIYKEMGQLDKQPKSEATAQRIRELQTQARTQRTEFLAANPKLFVTRVLTASADPDVPTPPKAANGRPDSLWQFNYYKNHYWDNFDLADERLLRSPLYQPRLERYIKDLTVQQVDSLSKEADMLVRRASGNKDTRNYVTWFLTSQYERPKVLGTDGLFIHMIEKYWLTGKVDNLDSATIKNVTERVAILKPLQVGKVFRMPVVGDTLARPINIAQATANADYTVMFFYAPHCGHCREAAPKVKKFTDLPANKGVKVVAVAIEDSAEDWKKFIREFKLFDWINGYDHTQSTDFRRQYDVATTPTVYVLDKSKKIIARGLPAEDVGNFLDFYRKQNPTTAAKAPEAKPVSAPKRGK